MLTADRFMEHCSQLVDPSIPPETRKDLATEVRDSIELVHSQEYASFLANFLPAFKVVLTQLTRPQYADNTVHKTRALILEILNRLPHNDVLRERILDIFTMAMDTLKHDNEENAVTAIHIIFDLHKNFRSHLGKQVQPFLDFVRRLYESFGQTVDALLIKRPSAQQSQQAALTHMSPSSKSFKVLTECPLLVMFVFQLYPSLIQPNIKHLRPLMVLAIQYEVPPHIIPTTPKNVFHEFVAAQVKTVSFLAYLLKQFPDLMNSEEASIPRSVVKLMQTCPGGSALIRKELLVATRHILGSPFRKGFFEQVDLLLDERVLVGSGRAATDTLRPLAYSFLAELVHGVRLTLSIPQLEKIIFLFATNVHDPKFNYTLQTNSVRLLLNLIEGILKINPEDAPQRTAARELLIRILETLVNKYVTLGEQVPRLLHAVETLRMSEEASSSAKRLSEVPIGDPLKEIADFKALLKTLTLGLKTVIWSAINIRVTSQNSSRPAPGQPGTANAPEQGGAQASQGAGHGRPSMRTGLLEKECEIVSRLLFAGQKCFRLYTRNEKANWAQEDEKQSAGTDMKDSLPAKKSSATDTADDAPDFSAASSVPAVAATAQEEREVFDQFAQIFTVLDPPSFQDVFGSRISDLFEYIVDNPSAITIPQHFLANSSVSKYFADILFNFLVENLPLLDVPPSQDDGRASKESRRVNCLLKLFKILYASVSLFPANEPVLRLHMTAIIRQTLKYALKAQDPHAYLQMLRALFKSITSGKHETQFELLYRGFTPLVEPLFSGLLALYDGPCQRIHKELIIELCLMIPARPSTIFPHLEQQIKPIVWALEGSKDNPMYGLRTLEFWVDMLQPSYLETLLETVEPDLTKALHKHLRPPGNTFGPAALRILGKLGSRSRINKARTIPFDTEVISESVQHINLRWAGGSEVSMKTDTLVRRSADVLLDRRKTRDAKASVSHKVEAWKFLFISLSGFIPASRDGFMMQDHHRSGVPETEWASVAVLDRGLPPTNGGRVHNTCAKIKHFADVSIIGTILVALMGTSGSSALKEALDKDESPLFKGRSQLDSVKGMCRYFALVHVQESGGILVKEPIGKAKSRGDFSSDERSHPSSQSTFLDSVVEVVRLENQALASSGLAFLKEYIESVVRFTCPTRSEGRDGQPVSNAAKSDNGGTSGEDRAQPLQSNSPMRSNAQPVKDIQRNLNPDPMQIDVDPESAAWKQSHLSTRDLQVLVSCLTGLVERFSHCCHQRTWHAKRAGVHGLEIIFMGLPFRQLSNSVFSALRLQAMRALLFLARDSVEPYSTGMVKRGSKLLELILRACFSREDNRKGQSLSSTEISRALREVAVRLTLELTCDSKNARETAKKCFRVLEDSLKCDIADILAISKEQILRPLQQRSIRQYPLADQIGYLDAVTFCLQLGKPLLADDLFSTPLRDVFLIESMYILDGSSFDSAAEADEGFRHKYHDNKYYDAKTTRQLLELRRKVLDLLCNVSVQCSSSLQESSNERLFRGMISCFFRCLQSRDDEVVQSSKLGLKQAISKHPKPKELLQHNLRPILGNLADYKKLTIPYLQGLSRVLELFSHWFNVNLGEKLLEHLQRWTEPEKIVPLKKMMPGTESKVAAAILDLFHLLPAAASKFLDQIVRMVLRLESVLALAAPGAAHLGLKSAKGASTSPYRAPLLKYCNHHAAAAATLFLKHLDDERIRQLFFVMIRSTDSVPLRKELMSTPKRLLSTAFFGSDGTSTKGRHIISLLDLLSRHDASWLGADSEIISKLTSYWKSASNVMELGQHNASSLARVREVKTIAEIFIRYCTHFQEEINVLFELLPVFATRTICDFTFVKEFLKATVTTDGPKPNRKAIITKFLAVFQEKAIPQERKVHALQYIVIPMVSHHLSKQSVASLPSLRRSNLLVETENGGASVVNSNRQVVSSNHSTALQSTSVQETPHQDATGDIQSTSTAQPGVSVARGSASPHSTSEKVGNEEVMDGRLIQRVMKELLDQPDEVLRSYDEPLSAEMLRLATELIRFLPTELGRYRKELIKFGWNHLKRDDSIAKHWAFVNVSRFFEAYQAPVKIILQVYVALLRACQGDGKDLVQQALDILTPALPRRLIHNPADHKYPIWIRYTKKILLEEGHSIPNLVHIWQLIARHPDLFYVARAQFVPIMVNSLNRIGLNTNAAAENRRLALDLVDLILKWELQRRNANDSNVVAESRSDSVTRKRAREDDPSKKAFEPEAVDKRGSANEDPGSGREPPTKLLKGNASQPIAVARSPTRSSPPGNPRDADDFRPGATMVDMVVNFLIQVPFRSTDRREAPLITKRCLNLLAQALTLWPEATVRLNFVEKILAATPLDRPGSLPQSGRSSLNATGSESAADGKSIGKNESQKNEKSELARARRIPARDATPLTSNQLASAATEQQGKKIINEKADLARMKRNAARHAALLTSIQLSSVLTEHQGKKFVNENVGALRGLVTPSLTEKNVSAAMEFAKLLGQVVTVHQSSQGETTGFSSPDKYKISKQSLAPGEKQQSSRTGVSSVVTAKVAGHQDSQWFSLLISDVGRALESCIRSTDAVRNYCGLIVLRTLSQGVPREFLRYQEILAKALHRMTKENLNNAPSGGSGGSGGPSTASTANARGVTTTDRNAGIASGPSGNRVSASTNNAQKGDVDLQEGGKVPKTAAVDKKGPLKSQEVDALVLCLSLLGENISTLESGQRKTLFHLLWALIDRCVQVEVLLEIVRVVSKWVFWSVKDPQNIGISTKEPLSAKEKVHFLLKMVIFERISGKGSENLMNAYLKIILKVFGGEIPSQKRPELLTKLERAFMLGLKTTNSPLRDKFFQIYDGAVGSSLALRLNYVLAKQEWEHLSDTFWIKHATELLISAVEKHSPISIDAKHGSLSLPSCLPATGTPGILDTSKPLGNRSGANEGIRDSYVDDFIVSLQSVRAEAVVNCLRKIVHYDADSAAEIWICLLPGAWKELASAERSSLEKSISLLLTKEYHQNQVSWSSNNIQVLLESVTRCQPLPPLRADVVRHMGSRWNAWHMSLLYFQHRENDLRKKLASQGEVVDNKLVAQVQAELEDVADAQICMFELLQERDYAAALWKKRCRSTLTSRALSLEQLGLYSHAQDVYVRALSSHLSSPSPVPSPLTESQPGNAEITFWQGRWTDCARNLCQWETLTEFSRTVVHSKLLHECLWRLPDWSALKELLIKNPVEDGPQLKLYQAYVQLQENKLDVAENFITQGYHKAQERFCALPDSSDMDGVSPILVQFQQLVELQESGRILSELNALSRHGNGSINVEQKIDSIRLILNTWRERLPSQHESLWVWNDVLTWRNHVHAVVVNVLDALKEAANAKVAAAQGSGSATGGSRGPGVSAQAAQVQAAAAIAQALPQQVLVMGVNETAWNVHRFAKACRKQGYPDVALYVLQKLYPFGTMELTEYFVKTKETARSFMAGPKGLERSVENGLHELSRCNMDHFNARQKAQLFAVKGKLCASLGREDEAVEAFSTSLHTSADVGSAWFAWGKHCDQMQQRAVDDPGAFSSFAEHNEAEKGLLRENLKLSTAYTAELAFRESAVNCYLQAARFGSRKTRAYLPRVLRLLTVDVNSRLAFDQSGVASGKSIDQPGTANLHVNAKSVNVATSVVAPPKIAGPGSNQSMGKSSAPNSTGISLNASTVSHGDRKLLSDNTGVSKVLKNMILDIPTWMWLPWLNQLIQMLGRKEGSVVKSILLRMAQLYPQALFFPVRAYMEERKVQDRPAKQSFKDALKLGRPIAAALRSSVSPAHLANSARQVQAAKENVQRANQRYSALGKELEKLEKVLSVAQGKQEQAALARKTQLKTEIVQMRRLLEKYVQAFQVASQRQRHIQERISGVQVPNPTAKGVGEKSSSQSQLDAAASKKPGLPTNDASGKQQAGGSNQVAGSLAATMASNVRSAGAATDSRGTQKDVSVLTSLDKDESMTPYEHADAVMTQIVTMHQVLYMDIERIAIELSFRMKPQREEHLLGLMNALLHRCYQSDVRIGAEVSPSFRAALEEVSRMCFGTGLEGREGHPEQKLQSSLSDLKEAFEAELAPQTAKNFPVDLEEFIARLRRWQRIFQRRVDALPLSLNLENISRHLIEINGSDVEVFGQYTDVEISEPSTDRNVKIEKFCANVRIMRRPSGPSRGIRLLGSDGKEYDFVLETSINTAVQSSEERTAQLYRLWNSSIFSKDSEAHRRRICLSAPILVPTGARSRLVSDSTGISSLADGLEVFLDESDKSMDDPVMAFRNFVFEAHSRRKGGTEPSNRADTVASRVEAYHSVCKSDVPKTCLSAWVTSRMPSAKNDFCFRKRFAETLGTASLMSHALAIGARRPQNMVFSWETGVVHNLHMRVLTSPQGIFESDEHVPFRLTPNLLEVMGPFGLEGPFFGCMATTLHTLSKSLDLIRVHLEFVMRDELVAWSAAKGDAHAKSKSSTVPGRGDSSAQNEHKQVEKHLDASIGAVIRRLEVKGCADDEEMSDEANSGDVSRAVNSLIAKACDPQNLAQMEASWQPWY